MKKAIRLFSPSIVNNSERNLCEGDQQFVQTRGLKPKKKSDDEQCKTISNIEKSSLSTHILFSSISNKLNPRSIAISSQRRWSGILTEKVQIKFSCMDKLSVPSFELHKKAKTLDFSDLRKRIAQRKIKTIAQQAQCLHKTKKICADSNCPIKQKWKNKLVLQLKDAKQAENLKDYILSNKQKIIYENQIDKDVPRSFPSDKTLHKAGLTLYHTGKEKNSLFDILRIVLKMLSLSDRDVGYVQGMNLYTAIIVSHIKQVELSFTFVKEVMRYGNMRKMYINNFQNMKDSCNNLLHRHIKFLMPDLYALFIQDGITSQMFMAYYLSMFACVVEYQFMNCIIDQFMTKGFLFFDKLMLSLLCCLKNEFLQCQLGELACKLGPSYIRSCEVPWDEVINLTQTFELN